MLKRIKNLLMVIVVMIQGMLVLVYGFSEMPVSNVSCLGLWCVCAGIIYVIGRNKQIV